MIGYATLGTNDIDRALAFYDGLVAAIGGRRLMQMPDERQLTFYGNGAGRPMLAIEVGPSAPPAARLCSRAMATR